MKREINLLLHNIRSVYNVGAIFRTADAIGVSKIYLSGYTPTPLDKFGKPRNDFSKSALGSEKTIAWEYAKTPAKIISKLKKSGFSLISVEQDEASVDYKRVKPSLKTLVVFGNEVTGVAKSILKASNVIAEIPMQGTKESLNIAVSAGIVLFRWFD